MDKPEKLFLFLDPQRPLRRLTRRDVLGEDLVHVRLSADDQALENEAVQHFRHAVKTTAADVSWHSISHHHVPTLKEWLNKRFGDDDDAADVSSAANGATSSAAASSVSCDASPHAQAKTPTRASRSEVGRTRTSFSQRQPSPSPSSTSTVAELPNLSAALSSASSVLNPDDDQTAGRGNLPSLLRNEI